MVRLPRPGAMVIGNVALGVHVVVVAVEFHGSSAPLDFTGYPRPGAVARSKFFGAMCHLHQ